jgi:hypothetical protein
MEELVKPKPILVYLSRHQIHPAVAHDLRAYDLRQITHRAYSIAHLIEHIELVSGDRAPLVITGNMPYPWVVPFIQACRTKWTQPGVTIMRVCMDGDRWLGWYARRTLTKDGRLIERPWIPQGSDRDAALQAQHRARHDEQAALLTRLEELGE